MGGGAFEHLHRGRSREDHSGCVLWAIGLGVLFLCVVLASIGKHSARMDRIEREANERSR